MTWCTVTVLVYHNVHAIRLMTCDLVHCFHTVRHWLSFSICTLVSLPSNYDHSITHSVDADHGCVSVHYTDSSRINGTHGSTAAHSLPASARQALGMTRSNSCENIAVTPEKVNLGGRVLLGWSLDKINFRKDRLTAPVIFSGHKFRPYRVLVWSLKNWRSSDFFLPGLESLG